MSKIYLVKYFGGSYDDFYTVTIFATEKKSTAAKYVTRFNKILKKWKKYYSQFEDKEYEYAWIKDEHIDPHFDRWHSLRNITRCYYDEVEVR